MFPVYFGVQVGNGLLVVRPLRFAALYVYRFKLIFPCKPRDLNKVIFTILTCCCVVAW